MWLFELKSSELHNFSDIYRSNLDIPRYIFNSFLYIYNSTDYYGRLSEYLMYYYNPTQDNYYYELKYLIYSYSFNIYGKHLVYGIKYDGSLVDDRNKYIQYKLILPYHTYIINEYMDKAYYVSIYGHYRFYLDLFGDIIDYSEGSIDISYIYLENNSILPKEVYDLDNYNKLIEQTYSDT